MNELAIGLLVSSSKLFRICFTPSLSPLRIFGISICESKTSAIRATLVFWLGICGLSACEPNPKHLMGDRSNQQGSRIASVQSLDNGYSVLLPSQRRVKPSAWNINPNKRLNAILYLPYFLMVYKI